jgi:DNA-binding IclR family transcriptional regulator
LTPREPLKSESATGTGRSAGLIRSQFGAIMFHMANPSFTPENERRAHAPAVGKAVRVLETIATQDQPLGVSEIGRRTGLSKSTVHALLGSLLHEGLLEGGAEDRGYRLGHRLIALAQRARDSAVVDRGRASLVALGQRTGESAFLGRLDGDTVQVLDREEGGSSLKLSAPVGSAIPVLAGALGKAYLGNLGPDLARSYLLHRDLPRFTDASIVSRERLLSDARQSAARGYALDNGEYLPGIAAAASCFAWKGSTYFLWVVRIERAAGADLDTLGLLALEAARALQRDLRDASPEDGGSAS